jgi:hypothetical protein
LTLWKGKFWQFGKRNFYILERKILTVWKGKFWLFGKENFDSLQRKILRQHPPWTVPRKTPKNKRDYFFIIMQSTLYFEHVQRKLKCLGRSGKKIKWLFWFCLDIFFPCNFVGFILFVGWIFLKVFTLRLVFLSFALERGFWKL